MLSPAHHSSASCCSLQSHAPKPALPFRPTATLELQLKVSLVANGSLQLRFVGRIGQSYLIEASSDMVHWSPIGTCKADAEGNAQFTDPQSANQPLRLYRVVDQ